ncbi:MAG: hypothetical protein LBL20_02375, partial [Treponema sp.]|nr:hypothetical protein [Treponema sp.]
DNDLPDSLDGTHWEGYTPMDPAPGPVVTIDVVATGVNEDGNEIGTMTFYFPHDLTNPTYVYTFDTSIPGGTVTVSFESSSGPGAYTLVDNGSGSYSLVFDNFYGYHPDDIAFALVP